MKIAIINDTHWGIKNDSVPYMKHFENFYKKCFFPELKKRGITKIIHLGDVVDKRKQINIRTAYYMRKLFFDVCAKENIHVDILLGNHDVYYKNTNELNALSETVGQYENVRIFSSAEEVVHEGLKVLYIPWISADNRDKTFDLINTTKAEVAMGHLELAGFQMYRGAEAHDGEDPSIFGNFDLVLSGHYHHKSSRGCIHYLGAPIEYTWSDYDDPRGFHVFDTQSRELEQVLNPFRVHEKIYYDDGPDKEHEVEHKIIKVIVKNKKDQHKFDKYIQSLEEQSPMQLSIIEEAVVMSDDETDISEIESTIDIFKAYIKTLSVEDEHKPMIENVVIEIYNEAQKVL